MKQTATWVIIAVVTVVLLAWLALPSNADPMLEGKAATIYKTMSCGCCGTYSQYADGKGLAVQVVNVDDPVTIK